MRELIVIIYSILAISLVICSKKFLNRFNAPFLTMWMQSVVSAMLTWHGASIGVFKIDRTRNFLEALKEALRVNFVGCLSLIFASLALKQVDASVFQIVARSLTIPFSVILSRLILRSRPTLSALLGAVVVTLGFVASIAIDAHAPKVVFTPLGVFFGIMAAFIAALHSVFIKQEVGGKFSELELVFYSNVFFALTVWPLILREQEQVWRIFHCLDDTLVLLAGSLFTGALAVAFNVAIMLQVKLTSPLTHSISSAVRGVIQNLVCVVILKEPLTEGKIYGTLTVLVGTLVYMRR